MDNKLKQLCTENNVTFTGSQFVSHLNLDNAGVRIDKLTISWPGNRIDGETVLRQVYTKKLKHKGWGKGEVTFFLSADKSPEFKTLEQLILHYKK